MTKPLDPRDRKVSEEMLERLWPGKSIAWECHSCRLVYSNPAQHVTFYPQCRKAERLDLGFAPPSDRAPFYGSRDEDGM